MELKYGLNLIQNIIFIYGPKKLNQFNLIISKYPNVWTKLNIEY
jgi:hypothetical protein